MNTITFNIQADTSKLDASLKTSITKVQTDLHNVFNSNLPLTKEVNEAALAASKFELAMKRATTASGQISFVTLNS